MDRREVLQASLGALSLVACSGESGEEYGEAQQAVFSTTTPSLLITNLKYSGTTVGSLIRLRVQVVPELYLGTVVLSKGQPNAATTGKVLQGTSALPGSANITISAQLFDSIITKAGTPGLTIEIEYSIQGVVLNIFMGH